MHNLNISLNAYLFLLLVFLPAFLFYLNFLNLYFNGLLMRALKKHSFKEHLSTTVSSQVRAEWDDAEWTVYVKQGLANSLESLLEAGLRFYQFKTECRNVQGGSDFSKQAEALFGVSASYAREWAKIGERYELLQQYADKLPSSIYLLKEIAAQPVEKITWAIEGGFIHANMLREDLGLIKKYDLEAVEKEREALSGSGDGNSELVDMSASSDGGTGGGSTVAEISFTDDANQQPVITVHEKIELTGDKKLTALVDELEKVGHKDSEFNCYRNAGGGVTFSCKNYNKLISVIAKILKFNNEQVDAEIDAELSQVFTETGYIQK